MFAPQGSLYLCRILFYFLLVIAPKSNKKSAAATLVMTRSMTLKQNEAWLIDYLEVLNKGQVC